MANKKFDNNFDIPGIIIFLALCCCFPVGIVLIVIKALAKENQQKKIAENPYYKAIEKEEKTSRSKKKKKSKAGGVMRGFAIALLVFALFVMIAPLSEATSIQSFFTEAAPLLPFFAGSALLFAASSTVQKREQRYSRIRAIIGKRESINLDKLAAASGMSVKKVSRDLQRMIDNGEFGASAYIDLGTNNFMRKPNADPDVTSSASFGSAFSETTQKATGDNEYENILSEIRRLNYEIKDIAVSYRIDRIEQHTKNIFDYVTDHPEAKSQIRTFMNYYLPTTLKLLDSYSRIERVGVAGDNMKKSKENIENILDLLVTGFEQQVDQLFKNETIDISSDISVLETMIQKDGLSGKSDFDIKSFTDGYSDNIADSFGGSAAAASSEK